MADLRGYSCQDAHFAEKAKKGVVKLMLGDSFVCVQTIILRSSRYVFEDLAQKTLYVLQKGNIQVQQFTEQSILAGTASKKFEVTDITYIPIQAGCSICKQYWTCADTHHTATGNFNINPKYTLT